MKHKYFVASVARIIFVSVFFLLALIALILRMYNVQIERHEELFAAAKKTYTSTIKKEGKRGEIYDISGNLLVGNKPCVNIAADPKAAGDRIQCMQIAGYFSKELNLNFDDIYRRLSTKTAEGSGKTIRYVVIKKYVDLETAEKIKEETKSSKFKGLIFEDKTKRFYPKSKLLANILGFINVNGNTVVPEGGIETAVNINMSPTKTVSTVAHGRKGGRFAGEEDKIKEAQDGNNVFLTISEPIQMIVEDELDKLMLQFNPDAAYAVMVDPYTGNIMAMAQRPSFDPNDRTSMDPKSWRNRITEDTFDPGSIMKSTIVAAALDMGFVTPDTMIDCENGHWLFCGKVLGEAAGHGHKIISVTEIIRKSSNIGTAKIGVMMGKENVYKTMLDFGFGQKTGIPLKPEAVGRMRTPDKWDGLTISRYPIGQGFTVTPLQMTRAYCALANGGNLVELRLIDRQNNPATGEEITREIISRPGGNIFKKRDTHKKIVDMLKLVTKKGGTAEKAAVKGYEVAGKTGTAQKLINGVYSDSQGFASFVGFVPADRPAFVLLVTADNPQPVHYGGLVAAPAFSHIAKKTLRFLNVAPEYETEDDEDDDL